MSSLDASGSVHWLDIPLGAVGVYFEIESTTAPAYPTFQINQSLGPTSSGGIDSSATWLASRSGGAINDWYFDRSGYASSGSGAAPIPTVSVSGHTNVYAMFDAPLLFQQRQGYFIFGSASNFAGQFVPGTTTFGSVSWVMTDEFPDNPVVPEPATLVLLASGLVGTALTGRWRGR